MAPRVLNFPFSVVDKYVYHSDSALERFSFSAMDNKDSRFQSVTSSSIFLFHRESGEVGSFSFFEAISLDAFFPHEQTI